jgi:hypothetical protein
MSDRLADMGSDFIIVGCALRSESFADITKSLVEHIFPTEERPFVILSNGMFIFNESARNALAHWGTTFQWLVLPPRFGGLSWIGGFMDDCDRVVFLEDPASGADDIYERETVELDDEPP